MTRVTHQNGFILLPVVLAIVLIATIAFLINTESAINVDMTANAEDSVEVDQVARAGLAHATWGAQNSGCAGDMSMTTVPFGQAGTDSYTATVATPGGTTTAYPNLVSDQDAWFRSDNPTSNSGTNADMHLRMESGNLEYALYRFDLSTLPAGAQINSASAWLYVTSSGPGGGAHPEGPLTVHRVTADWTETGATWDTMSTNFDSEVIATIPAQPQDDVWVRINITAQVQAWVNGGEPNFGILLRPTAEGTHGKYVSREGTASQQPRLDVIVGTGPATPATIQVTGTLTGNPSPANDITRTLTHGAVPAYQPASNLVLQPDAATGEDAYIWEWTKNANYGTDDETWVSLANNSTSRSLFRFNLAGVPVGAKILSATLSLHHESGNNVNVPITAHRISNPWNEAFVTWNLRDNGINWNTAGGDFDAAVISTTAVGPASNVRYEWDITSLVQGWTDSAYPNYGVALATARSNSIGERFYTSDETTVTRRPRLTVQYACECGSLCLAPQGTGTVAMVVVDPTTLAPADAYKKALFESWGYTVNVIGENANAAAYMSVAASNDVFYISETVNSSQVGTGIKDVPIGVVSEDGDYNADLGFATGSGHSVDSALNFTDTSHYITALFPTGPLDIYTAAMEQLTVSGTEAPGLQPLADTGGAGSLVVLDKNADMAGGSTATGRRVMLPLGRDTKFNWDYLNGNGRLLVQRALQWGTGNTGEAPPKNLLFVSGGMAMVQFPSGDLLVIPTAQEQLRIDLIESWGYTVNLIADEDSQANFDTDMAAADVAYVSLEVSATSLGTKLVDAAIGVVSEHGDLIDDFGLASGNPTAVTLSNASIIDNTHYITDSFLPGDLTLVSAQQPFTYVNAGVAAGVQTLADVFNKSSLLVADTGAELLGSTPAPGRRVQLPWGSAGFDINALNTDGLNIMQRAIEWAEGAGEAQAPASVLLVVDDASSLSSKDSDTKALIESWGFAVTAITASASQADYDTALAGVDVAYVSGAISSADLNTKLKAATVGVVSEDAGTVDDMGLAEPVFVNRSTQFINIIDNTHYVTSGLSIGDLAIVSSTISIWTVNGALASGLQVLGETQVSGTGYPPGVAVMETGAALWGGGSAAGRRVQVPWSQGSASFDVSMLNADGLDIMRRAIEWGAGAGGGGAAAPESVLLVVGDAATLASKDAGRKALMEGWGYTVTVIDDGDSQANFDAAAAAADVVYVSGTVGGGTLADKLTGSATPIVNEFPGKLDNFGFCNTTTDTFSADTFNKSDAAHYITSPFAGASINVLTTFLSMPVPNGTLAPDLQVPAVFATSERAVLTLDAGATRWDGNPAPARRAHLPFAPAETTQLTADGQTILQRALEWATGAGTGGGGGGGGGGPTGVAFEGFTEAALSNGTSLAIDKPTGTASGDLLIAAVATDGNTVGSLAPPAGWNVVDLTSQGGAVTFAVWWKLAGASEPGTYTMTWSGNEHAYGWLMRFSGHDPVNPIDVSTNTGGTSSSPSSPAVTTTADDALVLRLGGFDDDDITTGAPGLSGHTAINMGDSGNGGSTASGGSGFVLQPAAGGSGTSSFDLTNTEQYRTVTLGIAPAP